MEKPLMAHVHEDALRMRRNPMGGSLPHLLVCAAPLAAVVATLLAGWAGLVMGVVLMPIVAYLIGWPNNDPRRHRSTDQEKDGWTFIDQWTGSIEGANPDASAKIDELVYGLRQT